MTEKQYRLNKWGTRLLKNNRPLFDWTNEADEIVDLLNKLNDKNEQLRKDATTLIYANQDYRHENEQLKSENKRLSDKLNKTALEFLNRDMVTMGKATEISEMCYYDFLKYRKEKGNPMELKE